jgi:DnaJ-class molecular chaperone
MAWLQRYPDDEGSPDLLFNSCAGYVETKHGFIWHSNYDLVRQSYNPCGDCRGRGFRSDIQSYVPARCETCKGLGVL